MANKYFLFEDISSNWLKLAKEANLGQEIFIFSPYITGNLITKICKAASNNSVFVITSLRPDAYLGGSLDTDVLADLLTKDVKVFHLPKLHAKLMLVGSNLTIGSQNFTNGGKSNQEASIVCDISKQQIDNLEEKITDLLKGALGVNKKILDKFVCDCEEMREQYGKTQKMLEVVEKGIEQYFETEIKQRESGVQEVDLIKSDFDQLYISKYVHIQNVENTYFTLKPENLNTLYGHSIRNILGHHDEHGAPLDTFWSPVQGTSILELESQKRYLCFELDSLRLFWIRANKTQIGKFALERTFTNWQSPDKASYIALHLKSPHEEEDFSNIKIQFYTRRYGRVKIGVFFTGTSFLVKSCSNTILPAGYQQELIKDWDTVWPFIIKPVLDELPSKILTPFEFQSKNNGSSPKRLFKVDQLMKLGIQEYEDKQFFILDYKTNSRT